jgi:hypothetical protein
MVGVLSIEGLRRVAIEPMARPDACPGPANVGRVKFFAWVVVAAPAPCAMAAGSVARGSRWQQNYAARPMASLNQVKVRGASRPADGGSLRVGPLNPRLRRGQSIVAQGITNI